MTLHQVLDLTTAGGSALICLGVLGLIKLVYRRGKNLEDV